MPLLKNRIGGTVNGDTQLLLDIPASVSWGSLNIVIANTTNDPAPVQIFISDEVASPEPDPVTCVEPGARVPALGRYELSCRLVQGGEKVYVKVPAGCSARAELNVAVE